MYDSPINTYVCTALDDVAKKMAEKMENAIYEEVRHVGIYVDKKELIKALEYDRDQYQKGYDDAKRDISKIIEAFFENDYELHYLAAELTDLIEGKS